MRLLLCLAAVLCLGAAAPAGDSTTVTVRSKSTVVHGGKTVTVLKLSSGQTVAVADDGGPDVNVGDPCPSTAVAVGTAYAPTVGLFSLGTTSYGYGYHAFGLGTTHLVGVGHGHAVGVARFGSVGRVSRPSSTVNIRINQRGRR